MLKLLTAFLFIASLAFAAEKKLEPGKDGMFKEEISEKMALIEKKLHLLDEKVTSSTADAKKDLKAKYEQLVEKKKDLSKKIEEAKSQSTDKWENVKSSVKDVANEIETKLDKLIDG